MSEVFETNSLVKAAYLECRLGVSPGIRFKTDNFAVFIFPNTPEIESVAKTFEGNGEVPARQYSRTIGVLRDRLSKMRTGNLNVEKSNGNERRTETATNVHP